ncbi:MAG: hypothetical protein J5892_04665 [Bacilli bacterium]|nr:hypothetical protein [Bacilli bacterium]
MNNEQIINMSKNVAKKVKADKEIVKIMEDAIVEENDFLLIADFAAKVNGADIKRLERIIAYSRDPEAIYNFAKNVKKANKEELKEAMLKVDYVNKGARGYLKYTYLYEFAKDFKDLGTQEFDELAIKLEIPKLSWLFAKNIEGANIEAHQKIVLKYPEAEWITYFARDVKGADVIVLEQALLEYLNVYKQYKNYVYEFALTVKNADIQPLADYVIKNCNDWANYYFARDIVRDIEKNKAHEKVVLEYKNAACMAQYAKYIQGADIDALTDALISNQYASAFDFYGFACDVPNVNITKIRDVMYKRFAAGANTYEKKYFEEIDKAEDAYKRRLEMRKCGLIDATGD